jgi:hypothetical protein
MPERRFRYVWFHTWADRAHDFSASDGETRIGRVYRMTGGPADSKWRWTMVARLGNRLGNSSGVADSRDEACRAVEAAWEAFKARMPKQENL